MSNSYKSYSTNSTMPTEHLEKKSVREKHEERRAWRELKDKMEKRRQWLEDMKMHEGIGGA